jgi:hypothetical protein
MSADPTPMFADIAMDVVRAHRNVLTDSGIGAFNAF